MVSYRQLAHNRRIDGTDRAGTLVDLGREDVADRAAPCPRAGSISACPDGRPARTRA
ncbi:hypothetical protein ACIRU3_38845 [Streptomyces sp. NPDC101151]|uniref:hypothetical protein n=1 Tax=Streptomyces sp. NPDC101151 TaxID=3366115 RepID=UPI003822C6D6